MAKGAGLRVAAPWEGGRGLVEGGVVCGPEVEWKGRGMRTGS